MKSSTSHLFARRATGVLLAAGALWLPPGALSGISLAQAQELSPRTVTAANDQVSLATGERVILPFAKVSRLIVEDDEVARAFFQNGAAIIEGVTEGSTVVQVYQTEGTPKVLTIQVTANSNTFPAPVPLTPPSTPSEVPLTPEPAALPGEPVAQPDPVAAVPAAIKPSSSQLAVSLNATPVTGRRSQAQFTITYGNPGINPAQNVIVRFSLDEQVALVTGSASNGGRYDPVKREVVWKLGTVPSGLTNQKLTLRVEPVDGGSITFDSAATIEDSNSDQISSARVRYSTNTTPLLTAFALPDRFLAGRNGAVMVDVRGSENVTNIERLAQMGIVGGRSSNGKTAYFYPKSPAQRAEYAVMTINGLNLRDLRDITQLKFVLSRRSNVSLVIADPRGKVLTRIIRGEMLNAGEHTRIWNGRLGDKFAPPGRYVYVCTARDERGQTTTLRGYLTLVSQNPPKMEGTPSFIDVKPSDWYSRYLAVGEKQGLIFGFPDKSFRPKQPISRVEATAIAVRAMGLEDVAKQWADKDVGFLDFGDIPRWARGYVNAAATVAKTSSGRPVMRGTKENTFDPNKDLLRDQAALIVQRLIDREMTRRVSVSGAIAPGAVVTINTKPVEPDAQGRFNYSFDLNTAVPTSVAVVDTRDN